MPHKPWLGDRLPWFLPTTRGWGVRPPCEELRQDLEKACKRGSSKGPNIFLAKKMIGFG